MPRRDIEDMTADELEFEVEQLRDGSDRLRAQRNRAWRAVAVIWDNIHSYYDMDKVGPALSEACSSGDIDEYNAVVQAVNAEKANRGE